MKNFANDITYHRYVKKVSRFGIPHPDAREIVETAMSAGNGRDVDMYIEYAITLKYGFKPSREKVTV